MGHELLRGSLVLACDLAAAVLGRLTHSTRSGFYMVSQEPNSGSLARGRVLQFAAPLSYSQLCLTASDTTDFSHRTVKHAKYYPQKCPPLDPRKCKYIVLYDIGGTVEKIIEV